MRFKVSKKARRGRLRKPQPHGNHHNIGATRDPVVRARRVAYRRNRLAAATPDIEVEYQPTRGGSLGVGPRLGAAPNKP